MRRLIAILLSLILSFCLVSCGQSPSGWQEQYDLGVRYLSEGNYEEAVIAFSAAIGIDPKQPDAYIGMAEAYIELDDYDKAVEAVQQGREACGDNEEFDQVLEEITARQEEELDSLRYKEEDDGTGLNAYGATLFTCRQYYLDFVDMTPEQQQFIARIGNAAIANDTTTLNSILDEIDDMNDTPFPRGYIYTTVISDTIYTVWNGYKLFSYFYLGESDKHIFVQLRPENGTGYYCNIKFWQDGYSEEWKTCPCVGWQWNGMSYGQDFTQNFDNNGNVREFYSTESGQVTDNLCDGTFTVTEYLAGYGAMNPKIFVYQNGVLIEMDGRTQGFSGGKSTFIAELLGEPGSQHYLDAVYW